jgi:hypothetical protein
MSRGVALGFMRFIMLSLELRWRCCREASSMDDGSGLDIASTVAETDAVSWNGSVAMRYKASS